MVAKQSFGPYVADRKRSTWLKIRNRSIPKWKDAKNYLSASATTSPPHVGIVVNWLVRNWKNA
jgi:hypothetical protein